MVGQAFMSPPGGKATPGSPRDRIPAVLLETISLAHAGVAAEVVPARGALVTALRVGDADVLYLDRATLEDPAKNVRGGIPVLFPYAGKLVDERFVPAGHADEAARVRTEQAVGGARGARRMPCGCGLVQDDDTRAQYPYDYDVEYGVHLLPRGLQVELVIHNRGRRPCPSRRDGIRTSAVRRRRSRR